MHFILISGNFQIIFSTRDLSKFFKTSIKARSANDLFKTLSLDNNVNLTIVQVFTSFLYFIKGAVSEFESS